MTVAGRAPAKLQGLRHRHARRHRQPRRLAAGRDDAARGAADDRPRRLRLDLGRGRGRHVAGAAQGGDPAASSGSGLHRAHRQGGRPSSRRQDLSDALGFIRTALLVFAGVALLVGGFLIFNTFAVTVAQRTKEFALLRTLGASRAAGAAARCWSRRSSSAWSRRSSASLGGLALAPGAGALLAAFGIDLGTTGIVIEPRTVIVGAAGRRDRHDRLRLRPGAPRDARGAGRGDARRRHAPAVGHAAPAPHRRLAVRGRGVGLAILLLGAVRRPRHRLGRPRRCSASAPC